MSKIPTFLQFSIKDLADLPGIGKILTPITKFAHDIILLVDKRLTVQDNMDGSILTVIIDGHYPVDVSWDRPNPPTMVLIGQCKETMGLHTTFTSPISLDWEYTSKGKVRINNVPGLTASKAKTFTLTLLALVG